MTVLFRLYEAAQTAEPVASLEEAYTILSSDPLFAEQFAKYLREQRVIDVVIGLFVQVPAVKARLRQGYTPADADQMPVSKLPPHIVREALLYAANTAAVRAYEAEGRDYDPTQARRCGEWYAARVVTMMGYD